MFDILLLDDNEMELELLYLNLIRLDKNLRIDQTTNGQEAIRKIQTDDYGCIICDYQMPIMNGLQVLKEIRRLGLDTPFIFLTGQGSEEVAAEALRCGAQDYFTKGEGLARYDRLLNSIRRSIKINRQRAERDKALQALKESEEKYRSLFEKSKEAIFIRTKEGLILDINPAGVELFGYDKEELLSMNVERLWADLSARMQYIKESESLDHTVDYPIVFKRKDGRLVHTLATSNVVRDAENNVVAYERIIHDITNLKLAQDALHESEERFRSFFNNVPIGLYRTTPDGKILLANPELSRIIGVESPEELCAINLADESRFSAGYLRKEFKDRLEREEELRDIESLWKTGNGTVFVKESARVLRDETGKVVYYDGWILDITEKALAEKALLESEVKYRDLIEMATDGVVIVQDSLIKYSNDRFAKMIGRSVETIIDKTITAFIETSEIPTVQERLEGGADGRFDQPCFETILIDEKGARIFAEISSGKIRYEGKPAALFFIHDITERIHMEVQLAGAQRLKAMGQLASGIAHEINSPVQFISDNTHYLRTAFSKLSKFLEKWEELMRTSPEGFYSLEQAKELSDIYKRDKFTDTLSEIDQAIQDSLEGLDRVVDIVHSIKRFAHPATEKKHIDLNQAIESTITITRNEWKYVAEMQTDLDHGLPPVLCFPGDFNQAMLNLIINSVHAVREVVGDGTHGKGLIRITTKKNGDWVEIGISDTGSGIPEEIKDKIFEPFFTTKELGEGTGQGLAIVHNVIAQKHEGTISFDTAVGKGTVFTIRLPLYP